jgi:anti-anti-sigma factor
MKMTTEDLGEKITRIALEGRLDIDGTQAVDMQFSLATTTKAGLFIFDLSAVTLIASIGIRMLLTAARAQSRRGGRIALVAPANLGSDVLKTSGVDLVMPVVANLDAARAALGTAT